MSITRYDYDPVTLSLENSEGLERKGLCRRSERGHRFAEPIANTVRHELLREQWKHLRTTNVIEKLVRDRASPHRALEGMSLEQDPAGDDLQARRSCREKLRRIAGRNELPKIMQYVPTRLDWASAATSPDPIH